MRAIRTASVSCLGLAVGAGAIVAQSHDAASASPARLGRIEGTAQIAHRLTTRRLKVRVYADPGLLPASTQPDSNPLANVVLYLDAPGETVARSAAALPLAIRQRGERFRPHVLAVRAGSVVDFPNDDPFYHNVFSLSSAKSFDLGRYPAGQTKSVEFTHPGMVQIFCHIHADMSAYVLVFDHPYFAVPDAAGHFAIEDVPPGDYQLVAWHERVHPLATPVHVAAGGTARVQVRIPIPDGS